MLIRHRDDLAVVGGDLVQVSDALEERRSVRHNQAGAVLGQCEDRNRLPGCGERVDPLVAILKRQVDPRVPGNATPAGEHDPQEPVRVPGARRALRAVGDLVAAPAAVSLPVRVAVARVVRGKLLGPRAAVLAEGFRLLPPPQAREVQGVQLSEPLLLNLTRPLRIALWELYASGGVRHTPPARSGCVAARLGHGKRTAVLIVVAEALVDRRDRHPALSANAGHGTPSRRLGQVPRRPGHHAGCHGSGPERRCKRRGRPSGRSTRRK